MGKLCKHTCKSNSIPQRRFQVELKNTIKDMRKKLKKFLTCSACFQSIYHRMNKIPSLALQLHFEDIKTLYKCIQSIHLTINKGFSMSKSLPKSSFSFCFRCDILDCIFDNLELDSSYSLRTWAASEKSISNMMNIFCLNPMMQK